ncbi:ABC transporter permease [Enterococcus florum]|uniref:ABC transporter permease n=1 Tax=Enterococcus florum TaxID=2480627 RepID=A0A4V0WPY0_9ENTE|nr:FtsX-like permease family protein [Enterococcus florum]GCF95429.1 ABC transporter permease [Enterococcus florum]
MNKPLWKTSLREIRQSKARFLSIYAIIFLGVAFYVGLSATGPDMIKTATNYYEKKQLADTSVVSNLGISEEALDTARSIENVAQAEGRHSHDVFLNESNQVIRFYSYDPQQQLNRVSIEKGRLPEKENEVALDLVAKQQHKYQIGDQISLDQKEDGLKENSFKVVGFVKSPQYIENFTRGNTTVGTGSVDFFALISPKAFTAAVYSEMLIRYQRPESLSAYTGAYDQEAEERQKHAKKVLDAEAENHTIAVKRAVQRQIDEAKEQLNEAKQEAKESEKQLAEAKRGLDLGQKEYDSSLNEFEEKQTAAKEQIDERTALLADTKKEFDAKKKELDDKDNLEEKQQAAEAEQPELESELEQLTDSLPKLELQQNRLEKLNQLLEAQNDEDLSSLTADLDNQKFAELLTAIQTKDYAKAQELVKQEVAEGNKVLQEQQTKQTEIKQKMAENQRILAIEKPSESELEQLKSDVDSLESYMEKGNQQLEKAKTDFEASQKQAQAQLDSAKENLTEAQEVYEQGKTDYEELFSSKMSEAATELAKKEQALKQIRTLTYHFQDRNSNPGYTEYGDNAKRVSSLATVFPMIFFLIAALVTLTTMTRMVEEKRSELGTFKALGYKSQEIALKYVLYAGFASSIGALCGLAVGFYLFPTIIFNAYGQLYNLSQLVTPWYIKESVIALVVVLICAVGSALFVLRYDLRSNAASLMLPRSPKKGKRILLERITPIWLRLSFTQKVTMRNLFRYKQRMLMTIIGIAGCMSMIITGFGLRDSIGDIVTIQFDKLFKYQATVMFNQELSKQERTAYERQLAALPDFDQDLLVATTQVTAKSKDVNQQEITINVPESKQRVQRFMLFNDRETDKHYPLRDQGVIINEKLAELFDLKPKDEFVIETNDGKKHTVKIAAIAENYVGHFLYMSPNYYESLFDHSPIYNTSLLRFKKNLSKKQEEAIAKELMESQKIVNTYFISNSRNALQDTIKSLNIIMWVLIISAGLLAFVVLYNLTNINVSERIRELSTIKVLGFYDKEVAAYVYRENIFLTLIGILLGFGLGKIEHQYILKTVELDMTMFSPDIQLASYLYSAVITMFFTLVVGIVMYFRLKRIDMIEALKANE